MEITKEERTFGMLCHLLTFSGFFIPLGNVLGPLVIWLIKKDQSGFVNDQGKESLNFQISIIIYAIVSSILIIVAIGILAVIAVGLCWVIFTIIACVRANEGQYHRYPLTIRFIK